MKQKYKTGRIKGSGHWRGGHSGFRLSNWGGGCGRRFGIVLCDLSAMNLVRTIAMGRSETRGLPDRGKEEKEGVIEWHVDVGKKGRRVDQKDGGKGGLVR